MLNNKNFKFLKKKQERSILDVIYKIDFLDVSSKRKKKEAEEF